MDALMGGILGLADGDAATFLHNCLTFTLEMDSRMTADLNTCDLLDAGSSHLTQDLRLRASVVMHYDEPGPWVGPMQWVTGAVGAKCAPVGVGSVVIDSKFHASGFADPGVLTVLAWKPELNVTAQGEQTTAVLRLQSVIVQPGDPELSYAGTGDLTLVMGQEGNHAVGIQSKNNPTWTGPSGWRDAFRSSAGGIPVDQALDGGLILGDWVPTGVGDELARRDHKETAKTMFGTVSGDTTFILRHTPVR